MSGPVDKILTMITEVGNVISKARKHRRSLEGDNFYANKLAALRSDAAVALKALPTPDPPEALTTLTEHLDVVFSAEATKPNRLRAQRDARHLVKIAWARATRNTTQGDEESEQLFPLSLLTPTRRGYLVTIAKQMNGCVDRGWYDACSVMMRRLLEASIIEAYEGVGIADRIKNGQGEYVQLTDLVSKALGEASWTLSRNAKQHLPKLRDLGHLSAHGRTFTAQKSDVDRVATGVRIVVEEFLRHAGLLQDR